MRFVPAALAPIALIALLAACAEPEQSAPQDANATDGTANDAAYPGTNVTVDAGTSPSGSPDTASPTATDTVSVSTTDTVSASATDTASASATDTASAPATDTASASATDTASASASDTASASAADTASASAADTASASATDTGSAAANDAGSTTSSYPPLPNDPAPVSAHGLTNVSKSLWDLLEKGTLKGSCAKYKALGALATEADKLKCGKEMFFYEDFDTYGAPRAIVDFMNHNLPNSVGTGFTKMGMHKDPTSFTQLPLGLAVGADFKGMQTYAFTCASCHFGKMPDGRFAVGYPNHDYDYGLQILALNLFPMLAMGTDKPTDHEASAVKRIQPLLDEFKAIPGGMVKFGLAMLPLVAHINNVPKMPKAIEAAYAKWLPGTQDFAMFPVPVDDNVHIVTKILSLWQLPTAAEVKSYKMPHMMLGWAGTTATLHNFFAGFSVLSGGKGVKPADAEPLVAYLNSLATPANPNPPATADIAAGKKLFVDKGCTSCHGGPRYMGTRVFKFSEVGTDNALAKWNDKDANGKPDKPELFGPGDSVTGGVKSPRLNGLWAKKRLLHNGSVPSLEALFCLGTKRPTNTTPIFSDAGHMMTCNGLADAEKKQLIAFLRSI